MQEKDLSALTGRNARRQVLTFPQEFVWGVASSSYQMEGNNFNSQWYEWEQRGKILTGECASAACDWWAKAEEDFARAHDLGITGLRLSLEWSRIEPQRGEWSVAAFARYREMLACLKSLGIQPLVTLHHFTHPIWFERAGGFAGPACVDLFTRYAAKCVEALGDLCTFWCTVNEPTVFAGNGYFYGHFPPGRKHDAVAYVRVQANMLRAHAAAYRIIHERQPQSSVGLAHHMLLVEPVDPRNSLDRRANTFYDLVLNSLVLDALACGHGRGLLGALAGDLSMVRGTADYLGVNYYSKRLVGFDLWKPRMLFTHHMMPPDAVPMDPGASNTFGATSPDGIYQVLHKAAALELPIYITENGIADANDTRRPDVLVKTLRAVHRGIEDGLPIRGYYHWSLLDNFEWADGWSARFGLISLDPATQIRTYQRSAYVYSDICHSNAVPVAEP